MSLILLLCLVLPWACVREKNADQTNLIIGALIIVGLTPVDYGAYFDRADYALQAWNIGLQAAIATPLRNLDPAGYNPKNWIAITGDDCAGDPGVPSDFQGAGCPFPNSSVIGVCQIRTWSGSGDIADVTLVVRRSFQDSSVPEARKRAVFIHEVGHCLGLKHNSDVSKIMYPVITSVPLPAADELSAVSAAYIPSPQEPAAPVRDGFYFTATLSDGITIVAVRQYTFPDFYHRPSMSSSHSLTVLPPERTDLRPEKILTVNHFFYDRRGEETEFSDH